MPADLGLPGWVTESEFSLANSSCVEGPRPALRPSVCLCAPRLARVLPLLQLLPGGALSSAGAGAQQDRPRGCQALSQGLIQLSGLGLQDSGLWGLGHGEEGVREAVVQARQLTARLH